MEKATVTPRWKNRLGFGRKSKANLVLNAPTPPEEPDSGEGRSLATKRAQRLAAKPEKKKGGNMIRKLHVKTSFRKESRDASDTSNPQSPYSNDSVLTVEVSPDGHAYVLKHMPSHTWHLNHHSHLVHQLVPTLLLSFLLSIL